MDDDLSGPRQELLGLFSVLEGIENTWKKTHDNLVTYSGTDANLWSNISENVSSGRETVAKLERSFTKANKTKLLRPWLSTQTCQGRHAESILGQYY